MMADNKKTYENGLVDAMRMWGNVCGSEGGCPNCPIYAVRGTGMTCQEFAKKSPEKMISLLQELDKQPVTYFSEYNLRFPNAQLDLEAVASTICRKACFEGYFGCDGFDDTERCKKCWMEDYTGDVTVEEESATSEEDIQQTISNMSSFLN